MRKGRMPAGCRRATLVVCGGLCIGSLSVGLSRRASAGGGHDRGSGAVAKG